MVASFHTIVFDLMISTRFQELQGINITEHKKIGNHFIKFVTGKIIHFFLKTKRKKKESEF